MKFNKTTLFTDKVYEKKEKLSYYISSLYLNETEKSKLLNIYPNINEFSPWFTKNIPYDDNLIIIPEFKIKKLGNPKPLLVDVSIYIEWFDNKDWSCITYEIHDDYILNSYWHMKGFISQGNTKKKIFFLKMINIGIRDLKLKLNI
jgi:hypothetical protein